MAITVGFCHCDLNTIHVEFSILWTIEIQTTQGDNSAAQRFRVIIFVTRLVFNNQTFTENLFASEYSSLFKSEQHLSIVFFYATCEAACCTQQMTCLRLM